MTRPAYYNEFDSYAAQWLRNLIAARHLPAGDVDERSIVDVAPDDLVGYAQCHFFAGIGGWALAARLAGWPDDREMWTGSAPCQPFSVAGKQRGADDDRHLWPHLFRLASARRPAVLMGEQVAAAVGKGWIDGVFADMEGIGYACRAAIVPACAVDAPHRRDRLWFVAERDGAMGNAKRARLEGLAGNGDDSRRWAQQDRPAAATGRGSAMADTDIARASEGRQQRGGELGGACRDPGACVGCGRSEFDCCGDPRPCTTCGKCWDNCTCVLPGPFAGDVADANGSGRSARADDAAAGYREAATAEGRRSAWDSATWITGHDRKARRIEPSIRLLAHGVSCRVGKLRAYGNAIPPYLAAKVIGAYMDCRP